jgi:hypothetical protein
MPHALGMSTNYEETSSILPPHVPLRHTEQKKIFRLSGLKFDLTIPNSMPCEKVNFVFPAFCLISELPE